MAGAVNTSADVERREPDVGPASNEQPNAPYLEAVVGYAFRGTARYHVPRHKGGPGADPGLREAFGAERSWFLTNGATQGNHALCLALAPLGARIVAQRNSHTSIVDGLVLSGGIPSFVAPAYDAELGITHGVTPDALAAALREEPDARAAFIVSPTYYGMAADVAALAEVAHAADVPLVVDQSWGPHFGFHETLPPTALSLGADAMLTSMHKIAGSLTQSAMLHVGNRGGRDRVDLRAVARAKLETIPGIALVDASLVGRMGVAGYDPLRIVVDVRGTGRTGYEIADALRRSYDVHLELPTQATLVFVVGLGESVAALRRLAGDIEETVKRIARPGTTAAIVGPTTTLRNEVAVPPREAFLGDAEQLAVDDAVGRISCEAIASYPPGVPALLPGERISAETVAYLRELAASGARLHGASDPRFETINVLVDGPDARRPHQSAGPD